MNGKECVHSCGPGRSRASKALSTRSVLLLGIAASVLGTPALAFDEAEYAYYYNYISGDLGPSYAQEYFNLVKGNYRYGPKLAEYCIYAFANGFRSGYTQGSVTRQYADSGFYAAYAQQLRDSAAATYNQNLSLIRSWEGSGLTAAERHEVEIALYGGWSSGSNRGYRERANAVPPPTNADFRFAWSPGKSIAPIPSDEDPFGELRHTR